MIEQEQQTPEPVQAPEPQPKPKAPRKRKARPAPVPPGTKVHKGPVPKPLKGERSGQFIQRVIKENLWHGTDRALAELMRAKYYPEQVTTEKDVAWNRWKMRQQVKIKKH